MLNLNRTLPTTLISLLMIVGYQGTFCHQGQSSEF